MSTPPVLELSLLVPFLLLALYTIKSDLVDLSIPAVPVLFMSALGFSIGVFFPLDGGVGTQAILASAIAALTAFLVRFYTSWRVGAPAFGGADIAIMIGVSGMLGPNLLGPWILLSVCCALILMVLGPKLAGLRKEDVDGVELNVIPFCPALLISAVVLWGFSKADILNPQNLF